MLNAQRFTCATISTFTEFKIKYGTLIRYVRYQKNFSAKRDSQNLKKIKKYAPRKHNMGGRVRVADIVKALVHHVGIATVWV